MLTIGERFTRPEWDRLAREGALEAERLHVEGHPAHVSVNYQCHGRYGPEQEVEFLGWWVTVWAKSERETEHASGFATPAEARAAIPGLIAKVNSRCTHEKLRFATGAEIERAKPVFFGGCETALCCEACGRVMVFDSSG